MLFHKKSEKIFFLEKNISLHLIIEMLKASQGTKK